MYNLRERLCKVSPASKESLEQDEEKLKFYTGVPNMVVLMSVFNLIQSSITTTSRSHLSKFEQFVMVLMRLRHNFALQDLAVRFNISISTASRIFINWVTIMYVRLDDAVSYGLIEKSLGKPCQWTFGVILVTKWQSLLTALKYL